MSGVRMTKRRVVTAVGLAVGCPALAACLPAATVVVWVAVKGLGVSETATAGTATPAQQQNAAALCRVTFPPSTTFLYYHLEGFQDYLLVVKIELPAADVPALLAGSPFQDAKFDTRNNGLDIFTGPAIRPHFDPTGVTRFRYAEAEPAAARTVRILIDDGRPDVATVYLVYAER